MIISHREIVAFDAITAAAIVQKIKNSTSNRVWQMDFTIQSISAVHILKVRLPHKPQNEEKEIEIQTHTHSRRQKL